jgi:hypothetical protein
MTKYFVSRQCYWPEGDLMVEIAVGGLDYANPDQMVDRFSSLGEGCEFDDPREAVESAVDVLNAWRKLSPSEEINIGYGFTGGNTLPFEPSTIEECQAWAEERYEKLPKCDECGELIGKEEFTTDFGGSFCREYCADKNYAREVEHDNDPNYYSGN